MLPAGFMGDLLVIATAVAFLAGLLAWLGRERHPDTRHRADDGDGLGRRWYAQKLRERAEWRGRRPPVAPEPRSCPGRAS